jgi:competence protein ComGC
MSFRHALGNHFFTHLLYMLLVINSFVLMILIIPKLVRGSGAVTLQSGVSAVELRIACDDADNCENNSEHYLLRGEGGLIALYTSL